MNGPGAQLARKGGDFADGFPFGRQGGEEIGFAGRWNLFANEVAHGKCDLLVGQRVAAGELFNQSLQHYPRIADGRWKMEIDARTGEGAGQISSGTPFCRINAAFHLDTERRIYAAAKKSVVRPCH